MKKITLFLREKSGSDIVWLSLSVNALVSTQIAANSNISSKGFVPNSKVVLRIPTYSNLNISPGDRVVADEISAASPPHDSFSVLSVTDNRRGSRKVRHLKVVCG